MNKRIIELSKWHVVAFAIFGIGILLLLGGVFSWLKLRMALNISSLDTEDLRSGKYVKGEITQYAGKNEETIYGMKFYGVSGSFAYGITYTFHDAFAVPVSDGKYVHVLISDKALQETLQSYDTGVGEGAFFAGRVEKPKYDIKYDFWEDSVTFGSADEAREKICDKYVIRQIYPERIRYRMFAGLSMVITAALIVTACGRVKIDEVGI